MYSKQCNTCNSMYNKNHLSMYSKQYRPVRQHAQHGVHQRALQRSLQCTFVYFVILRCTCNAKNTTAAVHQHHMCSTITKHTAAYTPRHCGISGCTPSASAPAPGVHPHCMRSTPRRTLRHALHSTHTCTPDFLGVHTRTVVVPGNCALST